eukprot:1140786-Pyramimonas_sp.AAC.1
MAHLQIPAPGCRSCPDEVPHASRPPGVQTCTGWGSHLLGGSSKQDMLMIDGAVDAVQDLVVHFTISGALCNWAFPDTMAESVALPTSKKAEF